MSHHWNVLPKVLEPGWKKKDAKERRKRGTVCRWVMGQGTGRTHCQMGNISRTLESTTSSFYLRLTPEVQPPMLIILGMVAGLNNAYRVMGEGIGAIILGDASVCKPFDHDHLVRWPPLSDHAWHGDQVLVAHSELSRFRFRLDSSRSLVRFIPSSRNSFGVIKGPHE